MKTYKNIGFLLVCLMALLAASCTKNYVITHELERPLPNSEICMIGPIVDELPADFDEGNKPTIEQISTFREHLAKQLRDKEVFSGIDQFSDDAEYVVTGSILDYKKGSGVVRFFIGFGLGDAKLTTELKLIRKAKNPDEEDEIVFAGNFNQKVSNWAESGEKTFEKIAKEFAKLLEKRIQKLEKKAEKKDKS